MVHGRQNGRDKMKKVNIVLIVLVVALVGALGLLGKIAWDKRELSRTNTALNEQLMQANLEIGRAHTEFGSAEDYVNELEKALQDEINTRGAEVTRYGELTLKYETLKEKNIVGKVVYVQGPKVKADKFKTGMVYVASDPRTLHPVTELEGEYLDDRLTAVCKFAPEPGKLGSIPLNFSYKLRMRFIAQMVETILPSGAINQYFRMWEMNTKGEKTEEIQVTEFNVVVQDMRAPHFFWWAPHLDIGLLTGLTSDLRFGMGGSLGISFMGHGLTKNDLSWRFARLSLDFSKSLYAGITPGQYNLGQLLPLISNLWVGPHLSYAINTRKEWMLSILMSGVL